jgi:hypothetical protein
LRHPERDAVQPRRQRPGVAERIGLACEREERGLKRVVHVRRRAEDAAAHAEDHRPELLHQTCERLRVAARGVALQ